MAEPDAERPSLSWLTGSPWPHARVLGALAVAIGLVYASSLDGELVLDARALVLENPSIRAVTLANLRFILTHDYWQPLATDGLYRPLTTLSYLFNYAVLGNADRPFGYHALNVVLHWACAGLVYALVWHLVRRSWPAVVAAALFALHPIGTEVVANIAGRADALATLGVLAGVLCHARVADSRGWPRAGWLCGLWLAAALAFFSKESGLVLIAALVAYDLLLPSPAPEHAGSTGVRAVRTEHAVVLSVLALYAAARWYVAQSGLPPEDVSPLDNPLVEAGPWAARLTALRLLGRALALLVWPYPLSADYSCCEISLVSWPPAAWDALTIALSLGMLAALTAAAVGARHRAPALAFLLAFFLLALLPTANLLVIIGSIFAERFLYLPLAGFAGAVALVAQRAHAAAADVPERGLAVSAAVAVALLACSGRTWARSQDWTDELRLWSSAVNAVPGSAKAHKAYAAALYASNPTAVDGALAAAERALAIRPDYMQAMVDLGSYHIAAGDLLKARERPAGEARAWYEKAVTVLEDARELDAAAGRRFGERMLARGRLPEAIPEFGDPQLYNNLSVAYERASRYDDALAAYERSRSLDPLNPEHYVNMSAMLARLGRWEEAAVTLFEAATLAPDHRDAPSRLVHLYRAFYPEGRAIFEPEPGRVLVNLDDPLVHRHRCRAYRRLAEIYARAQLPDDAARTRELAEGFCRKEDRAP